VTGPAAEKIIAAQAVHDIGTTQTDHHIGTRRAVQRIITLGADNGGRLAKTGRLRPHVGSEAPACHQDQEADHPSLVRIHPTCLRQILHDTLPKIDNNFLLNIVL
jgi:hypothetical protein